ncbi:MAG: bacteriocin [Bacilli bacterium]|nr:bacteriocin [Bacilli bacterium]
MLKEINDKELESIVGGSGSISSSVINAITNIIKFLYDTGSGVGSAIRRIHDKNLCPTK